MPEKISKLVEEEEEEEERGDDEEQDQENGEVEEEVGGGRGGELLLGKPFSRTDVMDDEEEQPAAKRAKVLQAQTCKYCGSTEHSTASCRKTNTAAVLSRLVPSWRDRQNDLPSDLESLKKSKKKKIMGAMHDQIVLRVERVTRVRVEGQCHICDGWLRSSDTKTECVPCNAKVHYACAHTEKGQERRKTRYWRCSECK